jgi:hypothetical protein
VTNKWDRDGRPSSGEVVGEVVINETEVNERGGRNENNDKNKKK